MGAQQSSQDAHGAGEPSSGAGTGTDIDMRKTCYYEVLGVERTADEADIRKSYKRKALELHPDRNYNDQENATKKFAEVQTAYEILSDPQERAWYDAHRDAILRGTDADFDADSSPDRHYNVRLTTADELMSLIGRFNSRVPFNDSPNGFFGILEATFAQLATEETAASQWEGHDPIAYPPFGSANDDHDSVARPFFTVWASFSTRKSFAWKEKWRLAEAPDRRVRRLMDKENKKMREDAIRDFNDAVRSLVAFVRKRDPRYIPNKQSEADRQKTLRDSAATQAARARAANQDKLANESPFVAEWARGDDEPEIHEEFASSEEESEDESFECVVCDKVFKSEKQYESHEKSRKHVKALQQLRRRMKKEGHDLDLDADVSAASSQPDEGQRREDPPAAENAQIRDKSMPISISTLEEDAIPQETVCEETQSTSSDFLDAEYAPRDVVEGRLASDYKQNVSQDDEDELNGLSSKIKGATIDDDEPTTKKIGKAKAKRAKKAAQAQGQSQDIFSCNVCEEVFPSRTKLFKHVSEEGHALAQAPAKHAAQSARKGKKNKK